MYSEYFFLIQEYIWHENIFLSYCEVGATEGTELYVEVTERKINAQLIEQAEVGYMNGGCTMS